MRSQTLVAIGLLVALFAVPAHADEAQESPFNFHIGGGFGVPLNPTANFTGLSGSFQVGGGPNLTKHQSIVGEFLWQGMPPNHNSLLPVENAVCLLNPVVNPLSTSVPCSVASINASANLYALTANYMYRVEGERYGYYVIGRMPEGSLNFRPGEFAGVFCRFNIRADGNKDFLADARSEE